MRNRSFGIINIAGLSAGIAASIIMILYAVNELSFDSNNKKSSRISMVYKERHLPTGIQITMDTWFPLAKALQEKYAGVEEATHLWVDDSWVTYGGHKFKIPVTCAMQNVFRVFTLPLTEGDTSAFSHDPFTAIISRETSEKLFGNEDPIGKRITLDFNTDYLIIGVLAAIPENSTYRPEIMIPSNSIPDFSKVKELWSSSWLDTYVLLKPGVSGESLENALPGFVKYNMGKESDKTLKLRLTALRDLHNQMTHANSHAYILLIIALATLMIALVNFINLSTVRSLERTREIGVQKVLGASPGNLLINYLSESMLISFIALFAGVIIAEVALPSFNRNFDLHLSLYDMGFSASVTSLLLLGLFTGFISGFYPAWLVTKFNPVKSLTGKPGTHTRGFSLRNGLIVFQFVLAIVMLISTAVIIKQIHFMKNADLNIQKSNLMIIPASNADFPDNEASRDNLESFRNELENYSGIEKVTATSISLPAESGGYVFVYPDGRPEEQRLRERWMVVDENYFDVYGIQFISGRNFSADLSSDRQESVIINEAALRDIGWTNINEGKIKVMGKERNVIGVVKDYHYESLETRIEPMIHFLGSPRSNAYQYITVNLKPGNFKSTLSYISRKWKEIEPGRPLPYRFVDEGFDKLYKSQEQLATVGEIFTSVAYILSCMGLIALAALILTNRTKEIGIRKVLGGSVTGITLMLTAEFAKWVVLANLIAWPVAYLAMNRMLQHFAYRTTIGEWIFILSGLVTMTIAVVSIGFPSIKTAMMSPVKTLRYE